jgi:hypothetical protein
MERETHIYFGLWISIESIILQIDGWEDKLNGANIETNRRRKYFRSLGCRFAHRTFFSTMYKINTLLWLTHANGMNGIINHWQDGMRNKSLWWAFCGFTMQMTRQCNEKIHCHICAAHHI